MTFAVQSILQQFVFFRLFLLQCVFKLYALRFGKSFTRQILLDAVDAPVDLCALGGFVEAVFPEITVL